METRYSAQQLRRLSLAELLNVAALEDIADLRKNMPREELLSILQEELTLTPKVRSPQITLLPQQETHVQRLFDIITAEKQFGFDMNNIAFDTSTTGSGKTYTAVALAKLLDYSLFVVTPYPTIYNWMNVIRQFGAKYIGISNYEILVGHNIDNGHVKWYDMSNDINFNAVPCPYIEKVTQYENNIRRIYYNWNLPPKTLIVFDEIQNAKNKATLNFRLFKGAHDLVKKNQDYKLLSLTATPVQDARDLPVYFYMMGYIPEPTITELREFRALYHLDSEEKIFRFINQGKTARVHRMEPIPIPYTNDIQAVAYTINAKKQAQIEAANKELQESLRELRAGGIPQQVLPRITRARQTIEYLKADEMAKLANQAYDQGHSVLIFTNFKETITLIANKLKDAYVIYTGDENAEEKNEAIEAFQTNAVRFILITIQSGGAGISLHDTTGDAPRYSLISPPWSITDLIQALGRAYRTGTASDTIQRIVFTKGDVEGKESIEERVAEKLNQKMSFLTTLVEGKTEEVTLFDI